MRATRPAFTAFLWLTLSIVAAGQQPAPQAVALLQGALEALIGRATIRDVTLMGTAIRIAGSDNETGTATLQAMAGGYSRLSLSLPSGPRSETRNPLGSALADTLLPGAQASAAQVAQPVGAWSGPDGVTHGMANHNIMTDATWFFPALTVAALASSQNYGFSYVGQETHDEQLAVHLSVSQPFPQAPAKIATLMEHLSQMDLYLDPGTLLPAALDFNVHPDNNVGLDIPVEIRFSNYQVVDGVQVPFHIQKYMNNALVLDLEFHTITINTGLAATSFAIE
jgi:hypothetical protein